MKKFTFLASLLMMFCAMTANATDKIFHKVAVGVADTWTLHGDCAFAAGNIQNNSGSGGRGYFTVFNPFEGVILPETGYKFSTTFTYAATGDANKNDFEIALLNSTATPGTAWKAYSADPSCIWNLTQVYSPNATGEGTAGTGKAACGVKVAKAAANTAPTAEEIATANVILSAGATYQVNVNVNGANVSWEVLLIAEEINEVAKGSYVLDEGVDGKAASFYGVLSRAKSNVTYKEMTFSYAVDGPVAQDPVQELFWVEGAERDFMASFNEGEVLHWIQLGDAEDVVSGNTYENGREYQVTFDEAKDTKGFDEGEESGHKIITCNASGTLKMWTSIEGDETNVSGDVLVEVVCENIKFPAPVVTITNVEEGYAKEYTVTVDNSNVPLKPVITIHYKMGEEEGYILSGTVLPMNGAGTIELYSLDKTHKTECYDRSDVVTVENNVEYVVAETVNYRWDKAKCDGDVEGFDKVEIVDNANKSHWDRIYSDQKYGTLEDGTIKEYVEGTEYIYVKEGFGFYPKAAIGTDDAKWNVQVPTDLATALLPLIPSEVDPNIYKVLNGGEYYAWALFPCEGLVYYDVNTKVGDKCAVDKDGYVKMHLDPKYTSDDTAKPNFYIINKTGGYDRPDKGDCTSIAVVEAGKTFMLYRYDTAISSVKVMTYKGFNPGTGINNIAASTVANSAKVVKSIVNGKLVIVKDGKQFNVAGQRM